MQVAEQPVADLVLKSISRSMDFPESLTVRLDAKLYDDLAFDSLDAVFLASELEVEFDIRLPDDIFDDPFITVQGVVDIVQQYVSRKSPTVHHPV